MPVDQPWRVEWHTSLPSTMTRARELAEAGAPSGTVVVADYQSEGRGTHGRVWLAPPGTCLMFTILSRRTFATAELAALPLRVSASIVAMLRETFALQCIVKPPNDVVVSGRKLCGVLCTSHLVGERVEWVLCGIGLNTFMTAADRPLESATSLAMEGVATPSHGDLLEQLIARIGWLVHV
jgi:BirA family biotin operon repressor/biotin-[acetyl-CoA-carboxylase] ligase